MANFWNFTDTIQEAEGGYQKLPEDTGNYNSIGELVGTNHGISAKFYETVIGYPPSETDMRGITKETALQLFKHYFWDKLKADQINSQAVAETLVDMGINASPYMAAKMMQQTLNDKFGKNLQEDGLIGPKTIEAINSVDPANLFVEYNIARENYYKSLSGFSIFGNSWLRRIKLLINKHEDELKAGGYSLLYVTLLLLFGLGIYKITQ